MSEPSIYAYVAYRQYLRAWMAARPNRSLRFLADRVQRSKSLVSMVCSGARSIPPHDASTWAGGLRLEGHEREYWVDLIAKEEASTLRTRQAAFHRVRATRAFHGAQPVGDAQIFGAWYIPAILELARCGGFRSDPEWIASVLCPRVSVEEAAEALERLTALGVLRFDAGRVSVDNAPLATGLQVDDDALALALRSYHQSVLSHAIDAIDTVDQAERYIATLTLALGPGGLPALIERLQTLQIEAVEPFRVTEGGERVVTVALQVFPASEPVG
ncbi:MAG: hypothetical protein ACI9K2_006944 [Myxococcota bacterium]|jgi:uncharacterized protein (TIGR02147 family)